MFDFNINKSIPLLYQAYLVRFQIFAEDFFTILSQMANQRAIILSDRDTVDAYAYT